MVKYRTRMATGSFRRLERQIIACERCPRLRRYCDAVARTKVRRYSDQVYWGRPVAGFGDTTARLLVVGLAPGAHGANRTGRLFTGDGSGEWLYEALHRYGFANQPTSVSRDDGLTLTDCYVTAAIRCAPPDNRPAPSESDNCRPYLETELRLLDRLEVTIALGRIAHDAYIMASGRVKELPKRGRPAFAHGMEAKLPEGITLIDSYHPSRQNTNTGRLTRSMWHAIFRRARRILA